MYVNIYVMRWAAGQLSPKPSTLVRLTYSGAAVESDPRAQRSDEDYTVTSRRSAKEGGHQWNSGVELHLVMFLRT
jgi:hypothetical protein